MEAGNPVGLWDDGAVLAIVMVEEVQNTKEIVCLGFADGTYCFHADPNFFMAACVINLHLSVKCVTH